MSAGEVQRAELFANVDELMSWKKSFEHKQREMLAWQAKIENEIAKTIEGCMVLIATDTTLSDRIDIVNKRLRHLEKAVERLNPR